MPQPNAIMWFRIRPLHLLFVMALVFTGSGCASFSVWSNRPAWTYEPIATADGKTLSGESPLHIGNRSNPEIRVSYLNAKWVKGNEQIPPTSSGCIVLNNTDDSLRLLVGLESFLHSASTASIGSAKVVISHERPLYDRGSYKYKFRLGLAFRDTSFERSSLQRIDSSWAPLLRGQPAQGDIKHYSAQSAHFDRLYAPLDPFIIDSNDNTKSYFLVGGPSGGGPSGSTKLTFVDDCTSPDYSTLLDKDNLPFTIQFVDAKEKKQYEYPLPARILLTPFSVAFDVITFPVQLILFATAEHWMPR